MTYVRAVAPEMEKILGVEVVPENIPGAGGQKGAQRPFIGQSS